MADKQNVRDLSARILGQEIEYGTMLQNTDGSWVGLNIDQRKTLLQSRFEDLVAQYAVPEEGRTGYAQNIWLSNGARVYIDSGHLEIATPECLTARDVVLFNRATERLFENDMRGGEGDIRLVLFRDNSDSHDYVSFAAHENYLVLRRRLMDDRSKLHHWFLAQFLAFMGSRTVIAGNGSVEFTNRHPSGQGGIQPRGRYYLSSRARHVGFPVDDRATNAQKPIILHRSEALSGLVDTHWRLQLASGDPNVLEMAEFLKFGTTNLVLRLLEREGEQAGLPIFPEGAVSLLRRINADTSMKHRYWTRGGERMSALDIQEACLMKVAAVFPAADDPDFVVEETNTVLEMWARALDGLRHDPESVASMLDWVQKRAFINALLDQDYGMDLDGLAEGFKLGRGNQNALYAAKALEQRYSEVSADGLGTILIKSGYADRVTTDAALDAAQVNPPGWDSPALRTRAWPRGRLLAWLRLHGVAYQDGPGLWEKVHISTQRPHFMPGYIHFADPFRWEYRDIERLYE